MGDQHRILIQPGHELPAPVVKKRERVLELLGADQHEEVGDVIDRDLPKRATASCRKRSTCAVSSPLATSVRAPDAGSVVTIR